MMLEGKRFAPTTANSLENAFYMAENVNFSPGKARFIKKKNLKIDFNMSSQAKEFIFKKN